MKEIGELLREAREEKGITLEQISKDTKIPEKLLRDLEEGDSSAFAGKVYFKGALRNYAESIGLDYHELYSLYERVMEKSSPSTPEGSVNRKDQHKETGGEKKKLIFKKSKKSFPFVVLVWIAVLTFVVGGSIWYRYDQGLNNGDKVSYPGEFLPDESENNGEELINDVDNDLPEPVEAPQAPVLLLLTESVQQATYLIKEIEEKEIMLYFTGDCWISIEQDGRFIEQKTYRNGEQHRISGGRETTIRFGNPPMASILVNGQEISLSGKTNPINVTIRKEDNNVH